MRERRRAREEKAEAARMGTARRTGLGLGFEGRRVEKKDRVRGEDESSV